METGTVSAEPSAAVSALSGNVEVQISFSRSDTSRDITPLHDALTAIVGELAEDGPPDSGDPEMVNPRLGDT